ASAVVVGLIYALSNVFRIGWQWNVFSIDFLFGVGLTAMVWWYNMMGYPILERYFALDRKYPNLYWTGRIVGSLLLTVLMVEVADAMLLFKPEWEGFSQPQMADEMKAITMAAIVLLIISLQETSEKFYNARFENERLKLENSIAQFETLKQQINPHFLFNALNILKTLITQHDAQAELYLIRLSEFYRSLLLNNKSEKISLADELATLENYLYMLEIRFEGKFKCNISLSAAERQTMIPPFSLQMLLENAIKHNVVSADKPLLVEIFAENDCLVVRNNLQPKRSVELSSHIGLENISRRYRLLANAEVSMEKNEAFFIVRLPLIH
ncbi:MAG: histidine kinase, partial [Lewinellaceae bacterium]|nr:histidine kinase [Lewinellaceae bacterium]